MLGWKVGFVSRAGAAGSSDIYRTGFRQAPIGMAVLRPSGEILEVNQAMADVLGREQTTLIGANVSTIVHGDDRAELGEAWEEMGNSDSHQTSRWMRWITGTGRPIWGRVSLSLMPRTATSRALVILQIEDLTNAFEEQRRLERLVRGKDEFVAAVGNEIRDSLGPIIDLTDGAEGSTAGTLPVIGARAREIASIVDDLVFSAQAETAPVSVVSAQLDAAALCREVLARIPGGGKVSANFTATAVWADPTLTRQIVGNLVGNALRYGGDSVAVRTITSGPDTVIQVVDDGPEIPPSERDRIFSGDLRSGSPVTRPAAVGLSLTVGRHLARQMDGDIEYRRIDGHNVFELRLPSEQISFIPRRIPA
jgi:PAS domain S-box-containing protein